MSKDESGSRRPSRRRLYLLLAVAVVACVIGLTVYRTTTSEAYYSSMASLTALAFVDADHGWLVGEQLGDDDVYQSGFIAATSDAGASWTRQCESVDWSPAAVAFANDRVGWVATVPAGSGNAVVLATTDGGRSWDERSTGVRCVLRGIACADETRCWAVGDRWSGDGGVILCSTDGGAHWEKQWHGAWSLNAVAFADAAHGWAVSNGVVLSTADGGTNWEVRSLSGVSSLFGVACADEAHAWVCGERDHGGGVILDTSDGGITWDVRYASDEGYLNGLAFVGREQGWAVGGGESESLILHTTDAGASWTSQATNSAAHLEAVAFPDPVHGMTVGVVREDEGPVTVRKGSVILATSNGGASWGAKD